MQSTWYDVIVFWFLYFSIAAFIGWMVESGYRSVRERRLINSGFLSGPFIPIYGFGALAIAALSRAIPGDSVVLYWASLALSPSVVEFMTSWLFERLFGLRLWDYSKEPLNLKGRICLLYSSFWIALTALTVLWLEPFVLGMIGSFSDRARYYFSGALSMYFLIDVVQSSSAMIYFKRFLADLRELAARGGSFLPSFNNVNGRLPHEIRRLLKPLKAFPHLVRELNPTIGTIPEWITARMVSIIGGRHFRK